MAELSGRRVTLRPLEEADAPALLKAARASAQALRRRFAWAAAPMTEESQTAFIRAAGDREARGEEIVRAILDRRGAGLLGVASLEESPAGRRSPARLRVWLRRESQNRGYGTEGLRLLLDHAFRKTPCHRCHARIEPSNRPMRKVLKKLGFRYEGCLRAHKRLNGRWVDQECWGLLRGEWGG